MKPRDIYIGDRLAGITRVWVNSIAYKCASCVFSGKNSGCIKRILLDRATYCQPEVNPATGQLQYYHFASQRQFDEGKVLNLLSVNARCSDLGIRVKKHRIACAKEVR